ncbi:hypothetical protein N7533_003875 [Penicillium manginii]|uniref:uncharacterized protein n=1 Tax=Penicillium manginii TaxID=203109 RepID=UPI002547DCC8|nr:uncharacterized protein N7533_003875 [Penicillium manginii]KAJ5754332.1 hypothetical protein N7533_003875 [Penicillium manginii]
MLLLQSFLLLLPLWTIGVLATAIPLHVSDMLSEQKAIAVDQSQLSAPSSTIDITSVPSQSPESDHKNPIRNGDPYGLSDFGIDPAHVTSEQMQALREAGMIRELDDEVSR